MNKMVDTYSEVHNSRYWQEISPIIETRAKGVCLDIGCGPGLLLKDLKERYNPTKLIGIDVSEVMINKANEYLEKSVSEGRVELIIQHMQVDLNLPGDIDLVFSSRVLRSFDDQWGIMKSIIDCLNPGGLLVLLDWDQRSITDYYEYFKKTGRLDNIDIAEVIRLHRNFSRYSLADWEFILTKAGFHIEKAFQVDEVHICMIGIKN